MRVEKPYRVTVRRTEILVYEIYAENEDEARGVYGVGDIVDTEWDYDDVESIVEVDPAEATS